MFTFVATLENKNAIIKDKFRIIFYVTSESEMLPPTMAPKIGAVMARKLKVAIAVE